MWNTGNNKISAVEHSCIVIKFTYLQTSILLYLPPQNFTLNWGHYQTIWYVHIIKTWCVTCHFTLTLQKCVRYYNILQKCLPDVWRLHIFYSPCKGSVMRKVLQCLGVIMFFSEDQDKPFHSTEALDWGIILFTIGYMLQLCIYMCVCVCLCFEMLP